MKTVDSVSRRRFIYAGAATALSGAGSDGAQLIQKSTNGVDPTFDGSVAPP
jgi:hypothetical protein